MRHSLLVLAGILICFAGGCTVYYKQPGKTTADFDRDKRYCERIAEQKYKGNETRICEEIDRCLVNTKGWKRE